MKSKCLFCYSLFCCAILISWATASAETVLKFGVYTADKPTEMIKQFQPVLDIVAKNLTVELGQPVRIDIEVAKTYQDGIDQIVNSEVDFAQLGPISYLQAREANPNIHILVIESSKGKKTFNGLIVVHQDSLVKEIADLKGKNFAFGDELSTIGRYLSQQYLMDHGIYGKDLSGFKYLGRHDLVGAAVAAKQFDAGALKEGTFKKMVAAGAALKVLATFPNVTKPWIAKSGMSDDLRQKLTAALLQVKDESALKALGEDGFLAGEDADFDSTRVAFKANAKFTDEKSHAQKE